MGGPKHLLAAIVAVLACAFLLAACGGGDDDSSTSSGSTTGDVPGTTSTTGEGASGPSGSEDGSSSSEAPSAADSGEAENGTETQQEDLDLPDRGAASGESKSFQKYSAAGKLHLAEFGEEGSEDSRGDVSEVVVTYLQAAAREEWDAACSYLSAQVKAQISTLAEQSNQAGDCAQALPKTIKAFAPPAADVSGVLAPDGVASLRVQEGGRAGEGAGFALFHGSDGEDHWIAVKREDGKWLVLSTSPQTFQ